MLNSIFNINYPLMVSIGMILTFLGTCYMIYKYNPFLPKDVGRDFAVNGKLSAGKPRGAGVIFISVFTVASLLFVKVSLEIVIYLVLVMAEMLTGYLDDSAKKPWGELTKGVMDLMVAVLVAITYTNFNAPTIGFAILGMSITVPLLVYRILTVILVWGSINVTNCADGVDGLSGTLTIITLLTIYSIDVLFGQDDDFSILILMFILAILGYLWYNASPSTLLMGDAGSRAMGIFISIAVLKMGFPVLYLLVAMVLILDGGLGLIKVSLIRLFKIHILKNIRTPLHDHVRKTLGWSNTQTVFRFAIIQIFVSAVLLYILIY